MGLSRSVNVASVSSDGKNITLSETTGAYSVSNAGGFGTPNPAITTFTGLLVAVKYFNESLSYLKVTNYNTIQTYLSTGGTLVLNSLLVGSVSQAFKDGVAILDTYLAQVAVTVTGLMGNNFVSGTGLDTLLAADYVLLPLTSTSVRIYKIDKTQSNTNTVIYLTEGLDTNVNSVQPAYLATGYAEVVAEFNCRLAEATANMAKCGDEEVQSPIICDLLVKRFSADFEFTAKDYYGCDFTINSALIKLRGITDGY